MWQKLANKHQRLDGAEAKHFDDMRVILQGQEMKRGGENGER